MSTLTTLHVHDQRLDNALEELLNNAWLAALAGHAPESLAALGALLQREGAWRLPAHGALVAQMQRLLPAVALLAEQGCSAVGEQDAMDSAQLADWAGQQAEQLLQSLALPGRLQLAPAGEGWSPAFLATLAQRLGAAGDPRSHLAFGAFCMDAELVLKARIAQHFSVSNALSADVPTADDLIALGLPEDEVAAMLAQLHSAGHIDVAPAAESTDTLAVARAMAGYLHSTGFAGGYLVHNIWQASWLLLAAEGRDSDAKEVATVWLDHDGPAAVTGLLELAVVPATAGLLRAGLLEQALGVDAQAVAAWRATLATRAAPVPVPTPVLATEPPSVVAGTPTESRDAWLARLQGTPLAALDWLALPVPGHGGATSGEIAWAAQVPVPERQALWQVARALVEQGTNRWPVVTTLWSGAAQAPGPEALAADLFMRFPYEQGAARDDVSPRSFIATAQGIGAEDVLAELAESFYPLDEKGQLDVWRGELAAAGVTEEAAEGFDAAWAGCAGDRLRFERWLATLEEAQRVADPERGRQGRFEPDNAWLVLLPTPHSEEALAYLHWYGMERGRADCFIALLRRWREQHGAELWAHYGTMLEFAVRQPPKDFATALTLAREHDLAAPCTLALPGIALRHHALGLVGHATWFLHERP